MLLKTERKRGLTSLTTRIVGFFKNRQNSDFSEFLKTQKWIKTRGEGVKKKKQEEKEQKPKEKKIEE